MLTVFRKTVEDGLNPPLGPDPDQSARRWPKPLTWR